MKNKLLLVAMGFALITQMISAQIPSYVPTNGLVGYWPFNGNANDINTNAYNGTVNGATITRDRFGNANSAYSFNGTLNFIGVPLINLSNNNSITISAWVKPISFSGNFTNYHILRQDNGTSNVDWLISFQNNGTILSFGLGIQGQSYRELDVPIQSITYLNSWHHIVATYDGIAKKIYSDGILIGVQNISGKITYTSTATFAFGSACAFDYCVEKFNGQLDDIGIWNRALTQDEITSLYQSEVSCQSLVINSGTLSSFNPAVYQSTITIYPNPANDHITIDCGNLANVSGWNIKIFNTLSQEVFSGAMNQQQYTIPLNTWGGQGVYFVKIYDASNNLMNTKKIILQ